MRTLAPLAFLALAAACGSEAPKAPQVALAPAADTVQVPWVNPTRGVSLGGGRWAVLSPDDQIIGLIDFGGAEPATLGGDRHPAYSRPYALFRSGDSLYLADWERRRLTVWSLDGRLVDSLPAPAVLSGAMPVARDTARRFYAEMATPSASIGSGHPDSAAVVRLPSGFTAVDTIGRLSPPEVAEGPTESGRRYQPRALSGKDLWGVLPGGALWIARISPNRVDWYRPGEKVSRGDPLPDRALQVLPEDRQAFVQQFPEELRRSAEQVPFALVKPPFTDAIAGPGGSVWLVKSYSLADSTRMAQIVDPSGRLARTLTWAGSGRLIGVGPGMILVAEQDSNGYRLLQYPTPP